MLLPWWAGCSAVRLGYGQGPSLAYWWLDGYVDFTGEQSPRVKQALQEWFEWHRATQLPDYVALLVAAQRLAVDKVTPEQLCRLVEEGEQRVERAFEQAVPSTRQARHRLPSVPRPIWISHQPKPLSTSLPNWYLQRSDSDACSNWYRPAMPSVRLPA